MARGAYHFMTWCSLASEQAAWFIKMIPNDPDALPPVLDLEWNNHSKCVNKHDRDDILEKVRVMLAAMEAHTGKLPIIYTDINFHRDIFEGEYFPNTFWLRSTAAEPHHKYRDRAVDLLAVDADRDDVGRPRRGRPQRLLRRRGAVDAVPPHRMRSARARSARSDRPLPDPEVAPAHHGSRPLRGGNLARSRLSASRRDSTRYALSRNRSGGNEGERAMAKGQQRKTKEAKKPKKEAVKPAAGAVTTGAKKK